MTWDKRVIGVAVILVLVFWAVFVIPAALA